MQKQYFNNFDFFKIVFTIVVLLYHLRLFVPAPAMAANWEENYIVVEFFFIVSGFLLTFNSSTSLVAFAKKRYLVLAPLVLIHIFFIDFIFPKTKETELFLSTFFLSASIHRNFYFTWFITALFWASVFYFWLLNYFNKKYALPIICLIVYICYGIVLNENNYNLDVTTSHNIGSVLNLGVLRGFAGVGVGCLLANFVSKIKNENKSLKKTFLFSILECLSVFFIFNRIFMKDKISHLSDLNMIFVFSGMIFLLAVQYGLFSKLLNKIRWSVVSQFNYSVYVMQYISFRLAKELIDYISNAYNVRFFLQYQFYFILFFGIFLGVVVHYTIEKPLSRFLLNKFCQKKETL